MTEALLRTMATAVVLLSRRQAPGDPVYDDAVQRAYNSLVLHCLRADAEPPASVPDMVRWAARTPVGEWPADLSGTDADGSDIDGGAFLVDEATRTPTQACLEWAMTVPDAAAELFENTVIDEALVACRSARSPASYTAFRELLITKPVMTAAELAALAGEVDLMPVFEIVRRCYEPAPAAYLRDGAYRLCGRCGCLLVPLTRGGFRCELDRCRNDGTWSPGPALPGHMGLVQLRRPLRVFITSPGIAETDLAAALRAQGLEPEMWPQFDAYDLRVSFPDGTVWAVDVKDWANPALLAARTLPLRPVPRYDKAFVVIPDYRFLVREDYDRVFRHHLAAEARGLVQVCSDKQFAARARRELRQARRRAAEAADDGRNGHA